MGLPGLPSALTRWNRRAYLIRYLNPRRRRLPRHRQRLMHDTSGRACRARAGMRQSFHGGRHLVGHRLVRWCSQTRITCHPTRRARGRCLGRRRMLPPVTAVATADEVSERARRVQVSPASSRHSSTRSSSRRWGGTPRFAGWSASATPPYSRPRALRTRASNAFGSVRAIRRKLVRRCSVWRPRGGRLCSLGTGAATGANRHRGVTSGSPL